MDWEELKYDSARGRARQRKFGGRTNKHPRSGSEQGRLKKLGNSEKASMCSFCKPTLANMLLSKVDVRARLQLELEEIMVTPLHTTGHGNRLFRRLSARPLRARVPAQGRVAFVNTLGDFVNVAVRTHQRDLESAREAAAAEESRERGGEKDDDAVVYLENNGDEISVDWEVI
jgi:hypothetical protein